MLLPPRQHSRYVGLAALPMTGRHINGHNRFYHVNGIMIDKNIRSETKHRSAAGNKPGVSLTNVIFFQKIHLVFPIRY